MRPFKKSQLFKAVVTLSLLSSACGGPADGLSEDGVGTIEAASKSGTRPSGGDEGDGEDNKSGACAGGGFNIVLPSGRVVSTSVGSTIAASELGTSFLVKGTHIEFTVDSASFGVRDWTLTGAPNEEALVDRRTVLYTEKTPDHRGLTLTSPVSVRLDEGGIVISRTGSGLGMKIQAKDCAHGGVFQMEPQRTDASVTTVTHLLHPDVFFYDNPNFRNRMGETFQYDETTALTVTPRINFGSDLAPRLVGRDSPQEASRINAPNCQNSIPNADGSFAVVQHCGGRSDWNVKSGGRMGQVMGEDSIALEPNQPICTHQCRSRSQVQGRGLNLGFPSPVPAAYRFNPRS